jgi:hypothetical protein
MSPCCCDEERHRTSLKLMTSLTRLREAVSEGLLERAGKYFQSNNCREIGPEGLIASFIMTLPSAASEQPCLRPHQACPYCCAILASHTSYPPSLTSSFKSCQGRPRELISKPTFSPQSQHPSRFGSSAGHSNSHLRPHKFSEAFHSEQQESVPE